MSDENESAPDELIKWVTLEPTAHQIASAKQVTRTPKVPKPRKKKAFREQKTIDPNASRVHGFPCPFCGNNKTYILNQSGLWKSKTYQYRRRRICYTCADAHPENKLTGRFTTYESITTLSEVVVIKADGSHEPWNRAKLKASIEKCFAKRIISADRLGRIVVNIEMAIALRADGSKTAPNQTVAIASNKVGAMVLNSLKELDQVAYMRYASVFFKMVSVDSYQTLIDSLITGK